MALLRSDPFFGDLFSWLDGLGGRPFSIRGAGFGAMDAYREGDAVVARIDLPGVDPRSIDVTVEQGVLTIKAERQWSPGEGDEVVVAERPQGSFVRRLSLADNLDVDRVEANYDHGVLTLRLPLAEGAKPRKIEIGAGSTRAIDATSTLKAS